jgi:hypothetical protein
MELNFNMPTEEEIQAMPVQEYKVFENRMRRAAERQGLQLEKSRTRDPNAIDYGTYQLVDQRHNIVKRDWDMPRDYGLNLRDVGRYLFKPINVHIDTRPEHDAMTFAETNGEPILSFREASTTGLKDAHGKPLPDGWILYTEDGEQQIMASRFRDDVDEVVADAKEYLRRYYY